MRKLVFTCFLAVGIFYLAASVLGQVWALAVNLLLDSALLLVASAFLATLGGKRSRNEESED